MLWPRTFDFDLWVEFYRRTIGRLFWSRPDGDIWAIVQSHLMPDGRLVPSWRYRHALGLAVSNIHMGKRQPLDLFRLELQARGEPGEIDHWEFTNISRVRSKRVLELVAFFREQIYYDAQQFPDGVEPWKVLQPHFNRMG